MRAKIESGLRSALYFNSWHIKNYQQAATSASLGTDVSKRLTDVLRSGLCVRETMHVLRRVPRGAVAREGGAKDGGGQPGRRGGL